MNAIEWGKQMAVALSRDPGVLDFCQEHFGKNPFVLLGEDRRNRPGQDQTPWIVVMPEDESGGQDRDEAKALIGIDFAIHVPSREIVEVDGVTMFKGAVLMSGFGQVVWSALVDSGLNLSKADIQWSLGDEAPLWGGFLDVTITRPLNLGADRNGF